MTPAVDLKIGKLFYYNLHILFGRTLPCMNTKPEDLLALYRCLRDRLNNRLSLEEQLPLFADLKLSLEDYESGFCRIVQCFADSPELMDTHKEVIPYLMPL